MSGHRNSMIFKLNISRLIFGLILTTLDLSKCTRKQNINSILVIKKRTNRDVITMKQRMMDSNLVTLALREQGAWNTKAKISMKD